MNGGECFLLDSKAFSKIQSTILIIIIIVAAIGGGTAYFLLRTEEQPSEPIKIGFLADLDAMLGQGAYQGAILATEQLNSEGGILGRQIEVIGEDTDSETIYDAEKISNALNRLLTLHEVDFVVGGGHLEVQDIVAQQKKIYIAYVQASDVATQRVLDDYRKNLLYINEGLAMYHEYDYVLNNFIPFSLKHYFLRQIEGNANLHNDWEEWPYYYFNTFKNLLDLNSDTILNRRKIIHKIIIQWKTNPLQIESYIENIFKKYERY